MLQVTMNLGTLYQKPMMYGDYHNPQKNSKSQEENKDYKKFSLVILPK